MPNTGKVSPKQAALTLVRAAVREGTPSASSVKPAMKKKATKKASGKKKAGMTYEAAEVGGTVADDGERGARWLEEQRKLTQRMNKMYSGDFDEAEEDADEDHLAYYDYEAEEKALAARIAELKHLSNLAGPSDATAEMPNLSFCGPVNVSEPEQRLPSPLPMTPRRAAEEEKKRTRAEAAAAARAMSKGGAHGMSTRGCGTSILASMRGKAVPARDPSPELLEPFCIGRQAAGEFENIEVTLPLTSSSSGGMEPAAAPSEPPIAKLAPLADPPASEPPLTPRSLASSIAARRQANSMMRGENLPLTLRGGKASSPTGA